MNNEYGNSNLKPIFQKLRIFKSNKNIESTFGQYEVSSQNSKSEKLKLDLNGHFYMHFFAYKKSITEKPR